MNVAINVVKPSDVLREAANLILAPNSRYSGCCGAIDDVFHASNLKANRATRMRAYELFESLYKPKRLSKFDYWFHSGDYGDHTYESQQHRATALLLTADMAESVGE